MPRNLLNFEESEIEEDDIDFDVIIVGGGLTGLIAANSLITRGLHILILEQQDYTGGRLLSDNESECFYAHELQSHLNSTVRKLNLSKKRAKSSNRQNIVYYQKSSTINDKLPFYVAGEVYYFIKQMDKMSKNIDRSKETFNELSKTNMQEIVYRLAYFRKSRILCQNLIYVTCGVAELKSISAVWYFLLLNGAGGFIKRLRVNLGDSDRFYIKGGAMSIARLLTQNITKDNHIRYNETVDKIQFNDDRAHIWTESGHYKSSYVIIAGPPSESLKINIAPNLPVIVEQTQSLYGHGKNVFFKGTCNKSYDVSPIKNILAIGSDETNVKLAYDASCIGDADTRICGYLSIPNVDSRAMDNLTSVLNTGFNQDGMVFEKYREIDWTMVSGGSPMDVLKPAGNLRNHLNFLTECHGRYYTQRY